eukprot:CAMPEP_0185312656 /NCGR_PEP_ID=MMETSP1363-20130426/32708_1 /TAXON_ID=38817 /ORGANISM="Gephyrocapsa oceanica, Strain RCC1303" /LENGTH=97 /DNA_ID=CAMNT_0027910495 /DNA_START=312 /DNA_END=601 /DNA_ORIENTATION=-
MPIEFTRTFSCWFSDPSSSSRRPLLPRKALCNLIAEFRLDRNLSRPDRARDAAWKSTAAASCRACLTYDSTAAIAEGLRTGGSGMSEPDSDRAAAGV